MKFDEEYNLIWEKCLTEQARRFSMGDSVVYNNGIDPPTDAVFKEYTPGDQTKSSCTITTNSTAGSIDTENIDIRHIQPKLRTTPPIRYSVGEDKNVTVGSEAWWYPTARMLIPFSGTKVRVKSIDPAPSGKLAASGHIAKITYYDRSRQVQEKDVPLIELSSKSKAQKVGGAIGATSNALGGFAAAVDKAIPTKS